MRQVLISPTTLVNEVSFNTAKILLHEDTALRPGLNVLTLPFDIKPLYGDNLSFRFEVTEEVGYKHILLVGCHCDKDQAQLRIMLYNLNDTALSLSKTVPLLIVAAYETVTLRQIDPEPQKTDRTYKASKTKKSSK